jgi:hypothetical protein
MRWLRDDLRILGRALMFGALWWLLAYLPFFGTRTAGYHFNLSLYGLVIPMGAWFGACVSERRPIALRVAAMALGMVLLFAFGGDAIRAQHADHLRQLHSPQIISLVRANLAPNDDDGLARVIFVDDTVKRHDRMNPPPYLRDISSDQVWNQDSALQSTAFTVTWPGRHFRVWIIDSEVLPFLCARRGDAVLRVTVDWPLEHEERYSISAIEPCSDGQPRLPAGLDAAHEMGDSTGSAPAPREAAEERWAILSKTAKRYWLAYTGRDRAAAIDAGRRAIQIADELLEMQSDEWREKAQRLRMAIEATIPPASTR